MAHLGLVVLYYAQAPAKIVMLVLHSSIISVKEETLCGIVCLAHMVFCNQQQPSKEQSAVKCNDVKWNLQKTVLHYLEEKHRSYSMVHGFDAPFKPTVPPHIVIPLSLRQSSKAPPATLHLEGLQNLM